MLSKGSRGRGEYYIDDRLHFFVEVGTVLGGVTIQLFQPYFRNGFEK